MSSLNAQEMIRPRPVAHTQTCTLVDLTDLPRVGFRGTQTADYLKARSFVLPDAPNRATVQTDGSQVARLSQTEYLLLGSPDDQGERIADEEARWELDHRANYLLPRQDSHACFLLSGSSIAKVMAKLCGVDLSHQAFSPGAVAQTSAARINVIIIFSGIVDTPAFHILCDRASRAYFHGAMLDALEEFGGTQPG
jgi:sarcosine oxidase subunit gamma